MSTILIIDENGKRIKEQVDEVKGVFSFTEENMLSSEDHVKKTQFDIILCQVNYPKADIDEFVSWVKKFQPEYCRIYWMAFDHEKDALQHLPPGINNRFFIKPLLKKDIDSLHGGKLLEQGDIDSLFEKFGMAT